MHHPHLTDPPAVQLLDVTLGYPGVPVLSGVSLELAAGSLTALIGPNGAGKSTLLNAIAGLVEPLSGEVQVLGGSPARRRRRIAYVQQRTEDNKLLPISGREVVMMGRYVHRGLLGRFTAADHAAVDGALQRIGAVALADRQLRELSGGQQQRLLIAQGLAQQGDVLMLDEPVTGLDVVSREAILSVVRAERDAGRAAVMTTHDLADARLADIVVLLSDGVVAWGTPEQVLTPEHLAEAYGRQPVVVGDHAIVDDPHHSHHHHTGTPHVH